MTKATILCLRTLADVVPFHKESYKSVSHTYSQPLLTQHSSSTKESFIRLRLIDAYPMILLIWIISWQKLQFYAFHFLLYNGESYNCGSHTYAQHSSSTKESLISLDIIDAYYSC